MASCLDDLLPWVLTLLGQGVNGCPPLLTDAALLDMRHPVMPVPEGPSAGPARVVGYALGLVVRDYRGHRTYSHAGNIDGFSAQVLVAPGTGSAAVVLSNLHQTAFRDALTYVILDELLGFDVQPHGELHQACEAAANVHAAGDARVPTSRSANLPAVRPLSDYAGDYQHQGYGTISVRTDSGRLFLTYGQLQGELHHRHLEVFELQSDVVGTTQRLPVQFTHTLGGHVEALAIGVEPALSLQRFIRMDSVSTR